jgi:hypothetical protein
MPRAAKQQPEPRLALTVSEFCRAVGISRRYYYSLRERGLGPSEMRFGSHILISIEAIGQWREDNEQRARAQVEAST